MELHCVSKPSIRIASKVGRCRSRLYGRSNEIKLLEKAHNQACHEGSSEIVLIHGYSGTGKSALVKHVFEKEKKKTGFYLSGKFDQLRRAEPYSALRDALNKLCEDILKSEDDRMKDSISKMLGSDDFQILLNVIPKLRDIVQVDSVGCSNSQNGEVGRDDCALGANNQNKLKMVFRSFMKCVCTSTHPVILFLDDLQWADKSSLEIINSLTTGNTLHHFVFIGAYRDNEVDSSHFLVSHLNEMERKTSKQILRIPIGNLHVETVNSLVSDLFKLDAEKNARSLSDIIHRKTNGNIFFVLEYLEMLQEEGLLKYSFETNQWSWDIETIQAQTCVSPNVVELVAKRIQRLNPDIQTALKIAACIGTKISVTLMDSIILGLGRRPECQQIKGKTDLILLLDLATAEGLLEKLKTGVEYKFAHDRIQQAAYSLVTEGKERDMLHLSIGKVLWQVLPSNPAKTDNNIVFATADQLNRGRQVHHLQEITLTDMIWLNLKAGKTALSIAACAPAERYLMSGIRLVEDQNVIRRGFTTGEMEFNNEGQGNLWKTQYELCLDLYNAAASVTYFTGNFKQCQMVIDTIIYNAKYPKDEIPARIVHTNSLSAQNKLLAAIDVGVEALALVGERFAKRPTLIHAMFTLTKTMRMMQDYSNEEILALPEMDDPNKIIAMKLMSDMTSCSWMENKRELFLLLTLRLVQLSLRYGTSPYSPHGYAMYGMVVAHLVGLKEAYRLGRLSLDLLDRQKSKVSEARVRVIAYQYLTHWQEPLHHDLNPLLRGYIVGIEHQDVEWAFLCAAGYVTQYFMCGLPLPPVEKDMRAVATKMATNKQYLAVNTILPLWQCSLNLMGNCDSLFSLTGDAMDQDVFLQEAKNSKNAASFILVHWSQLILSYLFGNLELSYKVSKKLWKSIGRLKGTYYFCIFLYFAGLSYIELARRNTVRKWQYRKLASKCIKIFKKFVKQGAVNCVHQLLLLQAEYASLSSKNYDDTRKKYEAAIASATRSGFLRDVAIAYERAAIFHHCAKENSSLGCVYMTHAYEQYKEWGATTKADQLKEKHGLFFSRSSNFGSTNLGVSRFSLKPPSSSYGNLVSAFSDAP